MVNEHAEFWSKVANNYDKATDLIFGSPNTRSMVRERVTKEVRLGHLAEFGCGTGFYTGVLADKADRVLATDFATSMLALAKGKVKATNVTFQLEDCQKTSLPDAAFDSAFLGLLLHLTEPAKTLLEMRRILKPGGILIVVNVDARALTGLNRVRSVIRLFYRGIVSYRIKPPKGFAKNMMTEKELCELIGHSGFEVVSTETIRDMSRSSSIPVEYVRAVRV